ncbi:MAG TPA: LuxR C-terminal-related transcriptional regulator [Anaerolineales bacterium]|nr:LuxR C-terminal-related transcriptional regulator [Anaerolineales bacterium]
MISRFLKTKFHIPAWRTGAVSRPRLIARLDAGLDEGRKLTLVSAPAGYGKTTLAAEWIQTILSDRKPASVAWLSLEEGENDPARFLGYLISTLGSVDETLGQSTASLIVMPQLPPLPAILDELINDLAALETRIILFLDDYHIITNPKLHEAMEYFIEHAPASFHLVITTREDPPFALARRRARGQMTEVRAHDLRFTLQEAHQFFNKSMSLELGEEAIHALEARTEGWAVGLQLAALAMQNLPGQQDFLNDFSGSHRYVIDYLLDEVLKRQPPEIAEFLNKTATLKRFNAELCQAVTGNAASTAILSELERCNLFLIPLDNQRGWYRYHHLFANALCAARSPESEHEICARAARWFEAQGLLSEAIPYWLAVPDTKEVERLIANLAVDLIKNGELQTLLGWLDALPAQVVENNPDLLSYKALSLLMTGQLDQARDCVARANQDFDGQTKNTSYGRLLAMQAWFSSVSAETRTGELAQAALGHLDESDLFFRILALVALGDHYAWTANLAASTPVFKEAWELGKKLNHPFITLAAMVNLAFNLLDQGQLREAEVLCRSALAEYVDHRGKYLPIVGMIYSPLATICYEKGDFDEAQFFAETGSELCQRLFSSAIMGKDNEIVLARIAFQRGDAKQAFDTLQSTTDSARQSNMMLNVYKMLIVQVELHLAQGNLPEARIDLRELDAVVQSNLLKIKHVVEHLSAIYWSLANEPRKALEILDRLEQENREEGSVRRVIGVSITKALTYQQLSREEQALSEFEKAIRLAAPAGYRAPFFPRGKRQTRPLLQATRSVAPAFVDSILEATGPASKSSSPLPDPLSEQERRVLKLIVAGKSNQEIASELVISVGTAKWHVHNILQKLGVENRAQAIAYAHQLGIQ